MQIRHYRESDAQQLARIFRQAVEVTASKHYTPEQISAWLAQAPRAEQINTRYTDGRATFIAVNALDQPVAFTDLEADGHIDLLYALPEVRGTGVVAQLYEHLEKHARDAGLRILHTEASEAAQRFFARRGFHLLHRRQLELAGVPIHNYAMSKRLDEHPELAH